METFERCPRCQGRKKYMGMGMLMHDCEECKGIGYVEKEIIKEANQAVTPAPLPVSWAEDMPKIVNEAIVEIDEKYKEQLIDDAHKILNRDNHQQKMKERISKEIAEHSAKKRGRPRKV